jgi:NADH-quinone oxidoreductase subunit L
MVGVFGAELLLVAGAFSLLSKKFYKLKALLIILAPLIVAILFAFLYFSENMLNYSRELFHIKLVSFSISLQASKVSAFICSLINLILFFIIAIAYLNDKKVFSYQGIFGLLDIFSYFMCACIFASNLFTFFICMEVMGYISSVLIGLSDKKASIHLGIVFFFNKLASLLFLIAICVIAFQLNSFDFEILKKYIEQKDFCTGALLLPAWLLLFSCFCKSAQFPFSYWLILASRANIFASVFMHTATILGVGIVFLSKTAFLFDKFQSIQMAMIVVGILTGLSTGVCALIHTDVKKVMACSSAAYTGIMFISCGIGETSIALLYFICHAFFKSLLFVSFAYIIYALFFEKDILKMGGLNKIIPRISDIVWVSFIVSSGAPFCVGFFAKHELAFALLDKELIWQFVAYVIVSGLLCVASFRIILISIYGKTRIPENIYSRVVDVERVKIVPFGLLLSAAVFVSFIAWRLFEGGILTFEALASTKTNAIASRIWSGVLLELAELSVAIFLFYLTRHWLNTRVIMILIQRALRKHVIAKSSLTSVYFFFLRLFHTITLADNKVRQFFYKAFGPYPSQISKIVGDIHKFDFTRHVAIYIIFIVIIFIFSLSMNNIDTCF